MKLLEPFKQYVDLLHLDVELPTYEYLEKICSAHLNTFPFENISKLIYYKSKINHVNPSMFVHNYREFQFGGTCFTLNSNLLLLLKQVGFDCYLVMLSEQHMAIVVLIDGVKYYVDCGAAAPFFKPVDFEFNPTHETVFGKDVIRISPSIKAGVYQYKRFMNGVQSGETWEFTPKEEYIIEDFSDIILKSNQEKAPFMTLLRCQLYQTNKNRSVSLTNNTLTIRHDNGESDVTILKSYQEIKEVIEYEFKLPKLPTKDAIDILEELQINLFEKE
ncbi:arylamine N-acetyltransferase [Bacillus sp. 31A1R]|uniref:Arylamine N-acetyltransferase n=1 Tax=Robertmurraya mangrovi TaxID=3098077 RepID=A0ABU5J0A7_9BACI|nr:arylamine N-acetyltransferase [Bacillus sp. 31A1R]MDZ5472850.1 arylamine N-acetyltransferase [Bacillus sp. 31A1R]